MRKSPIWFLIIGIFILIVPTAVYLGFLIPQMQEEYVVLLSSGGVIAGGGMYGANIISEKIKFVGLYKLTAKSFTLLICITLVQEFIMEIIFLIAVFIVSFVIFSILKEIYKNERRRNKNAELADEITRNVIETIK